MKKRETIFLVSGIMIGCLFTLGILYIQTEINQSKYTVIMAAQSRRKGTPAIVRTEVFVEKGSELEKQLYGKGHPILGVLVDSPTDVATLYLERVHLGTLSEQDKATFLNSVKEYIRSVD